MSTITLPNIRVSSDLTVKVRLKDGGVAIDWSTLSRLKALIYSDDQQAIAGRCAVSIDGSDSTLLICQYPATKSQYLGVNRIVVSASYMNETKTYDKPALNFVRWTDDQEGEQITISDPDVEVEIEVEDVSSSILQEAVDAAFSAAERAEDAAEAAEHMVDIHTGPAGKSAYEVAVEEGYTGTEEEWLASLKGPIGETPDISIGTVTTVEPGTPAAASMTGTPEAPVLNLSIPKGLVGATPNFTVGTVTTGAPGSSVIVTITGTPEAPVLNLTIPQGMQGNTGSSVEYPYELVNNLTTNDATKGLSAAQGYVLDGKVSQLEHKVTDIEDTLNGPELGAENVIPYAMESYGKWNEDEVNYSAGYRLCPPNATVKITAKSTEKVFFAFITALPTQTNDPIAFADGASRQTINAGESVTVTAPSDTVYIAYNKHYYAHDYTPQSIELQGVDGLVDRVEELEEQVEDLLPLAGDVETLEGKVESLEADVEDLEDIVIGKELGEENVIPYGMQTTWWDKDAVNYSSGYRLCPPGATIKITAGAENATYAFITELPTLSSEPIAFVEGGSRQTLNAGESVTVVVPSDTVYLAYNKHYYAHDYSPASIELISPIGLIKKVEDLKELLPVAGEVEKSIDGVWERGGIGDDGKMLSSNTDKNYTRTLRTRNYIKCSSFTYVPRAGETLVVYEYDKDLSFIQKVTVTASYTMPNNAKYIKMTLFSNNTDNEVSITLSGGSISSSTGDAFSQSPSLYMHTDFIDFEDIPFEDIWYIADGIVAYYYDSDHTYIKPGGNVMRFAQWAGCYCNKEALLSAPRNAGVTNAKYLRIMFQNATSITPEQMDARFTTGNDVALACPNITMTGFEECKNEYLGAIVDDKVSTFLFDVTPCKGFSVTATESAVTPPIELYDNKTYFASMKLVLPPNYTIKGKPSKLIIWCQGSGDYINIGESVLSSTANYVANMSYWINSGYAIMSVWPVTSKYSTGEGDINGQPSNMAAYEAAYKWVIAHFNIDASGCYVSAKSMGGVAALALLYSNIPIKAADLFAPALNPFYQQLGYRISTRKYFVEELNLVGCDALFENTSSKPVSDSVFNQMMIDNKFKMQGHNAFFACVANKTFEQLVALGRTTPGSYDDVIKFCKVPLRIHIALDDTTVSYYQSLNLITAIKNGNCIAEIRTLPAGCSAPHHATDSDPDALKVDSITTRLGVTLTDIALAYVEALDWFEAFE